MIWNILPHDPYLKAGGWWPPVTAAHIRPAPEIVIRNWRIACHPLPVYSVGANS